MVHRPYVVDHLVYVGRQALVEELRLGCEQILQGALRALNLAGEHRLLAHIHEDEEVGVRQREHRAVEATQRPVGSGEQALQLAAQRQCGLWRERCRHERPVARGLGDVASRSARH